MITIKSILSAVLDTRTFGATGMLTAEQIACMGHRDGIYGDINGREVVARVVRAAARGGEIAAKLTYVNGGAVSTATIKKMMVFTDMERETARVLAETAELVSTLNEIDAELAKLKPI